MNSLYSLQIEYQLRSKKSWIAVWTSTELGPILTAAKWCKEPHRIVVVILAEKGEENDQC